MPRAQVVAIPHTPEWYAARKTGFGASEIAIAAGLSKYSTPLELYARKRGELPPIEETEAMELGTLLEPVVRTLFERRTGIAIADKSPPMFRHPEHDFLFATPDGIVDDSTLVECKTTNFRLLQEWGDEESDSVPTPYVCQTQMQMSCLDAGVCHLALLIDGIRFRHYKVLRSDKLIAHLIAAAAELWERIQNGNPPEPDWRHASTLELMKELHQSIDNTRVVLTDEEVAHWTEYERLGKEITILQERRDERKARVLHAIGDHGAGLLHDGRMVRRKWIEKKPYTVEPKPYIDVCAVKSDAGRIVERDVTALPANTVLSPKVSA